MEGLQIEQTVVLSVEEIDVFKINDDGGVDDST